MVLFFSDTATVELHMQGLYLVEVYKWLDILEHPSTHNSCIKSTSAVDPLDKRSLIFSRDGREMLELLPVTVYMSICMQKVC